MKFAFRKTRVLASIGMLAAVIALFGSAPAYAVVVTSSLAGSVTTETGLPVVTHSTIELLDSHGTLLDVLTTVPGVYKANTTGMTPPILIKSGNLFGYSESLKGVANVTPFSDLIVNQIYQAYGTNAAAEFTSGMPALITAIQLQTSLALANDVFQQASTAYKIPPTFNWLTSKFNYKSGFGKLLSNTTFDGFGTDTQNVQSSLPNLEFTATFNADSGQHRSISVWQSQLPSMGPYSVSGGYTFIPSDPNAAATYAGVQNFFKTEFLPVLKHEKKLLDNYNLLSFYAPSFLNSGKDAFTQSEFDATEWRKLKFTGINLGYIRNYEENSPDPSHNRITLAVDYRESLNGGTFTKRRFEDFICNSDGTGCLFYGNQQLGGARSEIKFESTSDSPGIPSTLQKLRATLFTPQNTFLSVNLSDALGSYFTDAPMDLSTKTITLQPLHNGPTVPYFKDDFSLSATLLAPFVYTNELTYDALINPTGSVEYDSYVYGYTSEPINWLAPDVNGSHQLSDFKLGRPIVVKFLPQVTYPVVSVELNGKACNATESIRLDSVQKFLSPKAKSASIVVPKLVMGLPTAGFELRLRSEGAYGQYSSFKYLVGASCPGF
jgi:hypothetical protein